MDKYIINLTEEQGEKALSKFTVKEQELIKKMAEDFKVLIKEIDEEEKNKWQKFIK